MEKGWKATGLLEAVWARIGGRDELARLTGIQAGTLSGYNTGRLRLGIANARRIADAIPGVTVFDLGAPEEAAATREERRVIDRLRELEEALDLLGPNLERLAGLPERVTALEQPAPPRSEQAGPP